MLQVVVCDQNTLQVALGKRDGIYDEFGISWINHETVVVCSGDQITYTLSSTQIKTIIVSKRRNGHNAIFDGNFGLLGKGTNETSGFESRFRE